MTLSPTMTGNSSKHYDISSPEMSEYVAKWLDRSPTARQRAALRKAFEEDRKPSTPATKVARADKHAKH